MRLTLALLALMWMPAAFGQGNTLPVSEKFTYRVEWRLITAGRAWLNWEASQQYPPSYQIKLRLESVGLVSKLFRVEDDYSASLNQAMCVVSAQLNSREGRREHDTRVNFDYDAKKAGYLERDLVKNSTVAQQEMELPPCVHDVIGGVFYLRTLNLEPGQSGQAPVSDGKKAAMARIEAQQREDLTLPAGAFKTVRYEIFVFDNVLFRRSAHLYIWLTDDRRKLPVQIQVKMPFTTGTITLELEKQG